MKTRVISGLIITALVVVLALTGGLPLLAALVFCSILAYRELTGAMKVHDAEKEKQNALEIAGEAAIVIYYALLAYMNLSQDSETFQRSANDLVLFMILALFLVLMAIYVFTFPKYRAEQVVPAFFSFVYAPVLLSFIFRARCLPYGLLVFAFIFLCSWICDTCAYAVGSRFGKHRLAPVLSPKKSIEGAVGGVAGSAITCLIAALIAGKVCPELHIEAGAVVLGIAGSIISQVGDLAASAIKRNHGIKDYGNFIPGHGGIMDRFDSAIFTAPIIYFLASWLLR